MRIGSWNVRTLLSPGKMEEVANELKKYEVRSLQEVRWGGERVVDREEYAIWRSREAGK